MLSFSLGTTRMDQDIRDMFWPPGRVDRRENNIIGEGRFLDVKKEEEKLADLQGLLEADDWLKGAEE